MRFAGFLLGLLTALGAGYGVGTLLEPTDAGGRRQAPPGQDHGTSEAPHTQPHTGAPR